MDYVTTTVKESDSDTIIMVIVLVAGVGGVFILFALMALCYRYVTLAPSLCFPSSHFGTRFWTPNFQTD